MRKESRFFVGGEIGEEKGKGKREDNERRGGDCFRERKKENNLIFTPQMDRWMDRWR